MTKQEAIKEYNATNKGYNITGIKKINKESLQWQKLNHAKSLDELYKSYSDAKYNSYQKILEYYRPLEIIGLQGNSMTYSITLVAGNGDTLWITRDNNYLVDVV